METKVALNRIRTKVVAVLKNIARMSVFVIRHPFKTAKICFIAITIRVPLFVIFHPLKTAKACFRTTMGLILLCYLSAYFYPRPLDYLVMVAHYVFFGKSEYPNLDKFIRFEEPAIGEIYDTQGKVVIKLAKEYRRINNFSDFPSLVVGAVVSTEDRRFFEHDGIDYWVLFTSVPWDVIGDSWNATSKHRPYIKPTLVFSRGGSTLTQQGVRLHLLSDVTKMEKSKKLIVDNWRTRALTMLPFAEIKNVNTGLRKIKELYESRYTEKEFRKIYGSKRRAKEELFARYASSVYLGSVYGIGYGGEYYFGKDIRSFKKEDTAKAAFLAGMIKYPLPRAFSLKRETPLKYIVRKNEILRLMAVNGYITYKEAEGFMKEEVKFFPLDKEKTTAPSVVDNALKEIRNRGFSSDDLFKGFIHVNSTVDLRIQKIANEACESGIQSYEKRHPENIGEVQCSIVVLRNKNGAILAEVGGRRWYQDRQYRYSDLNRVYRSRQAGSAFKPIPYLTAFRKENGRKPGDFISDSPYPILMGYGRGYHWINNYDNKSRGDITLCEALYRSRNAPTVRLTQGLGQGSFEESGIKKVIDTAKLLGIQSPFHSAVDHKGRTVYYPTSALGASEVTVIELANAYREIASGLSAEPYMIKQIIGRNTKVVFEKTDTTEPSEIDREALDMVRSCLRKVVTQPGGTAYSLTVENFPVPVAGKTGTTDDFRNALFAGFTCGQEGVTTAARLDFDDNRELGSGETGARTALPIFKEIMLKIYEQNLVGSVPQCPPHMENWP